MTAPPTRIHPIAIVVADLARAEAFYTEVIGLRVERRGDDASGAPRSVSLTLGEAIVMLERAGREGPTRGEEAPGLHCLALAIGVETREEWRRRFVDAGCPLVRETPHSLDVRDPDGNLRALSHSPVGVG